MIINTSELPMTINAVRNVVIKKAMEKMIKQYKQKYIELGYSFIVIAFILSIIAIILSDNHYPQSIIRIPLFILIMFGLSFIIFAKNGAAERECRIENNYKNYGLSDQEVDHMMISYMENILDSLNSELESLDKKAETKEVEEISDAYYKVYITYNKLILQINPQYYSSIFSEMSKKKLSIFYKNTKYNV